MDTINDLDQTQNRSSNSELNVDMDIGIVREFSFTSSLQRMAVVTRKLMDKNFNVYCKGSPEMIQTLCKPVCTFNLCLFFCFFLNLMHQFSTEILSLNAGHNSK